MVLKLKLTTLESAPSLKQPEVGQLIRELRQLLGQTQEQFAALLGVSFSTLNRWERGHMQPSPLALRQVYAVLTQLSDSSDATLKTGSQALWQKYLDNRPPN